MRPIPPLAIFTLFCVGLEAIVGLCLGLSNGLSEMHKTVLVAFVVGFPTVTLLIFLPIMARAQKLETAWYYGSEPAEPADTTVNAG
jgi:hypothetical protein